MLASNDIVGLFIGLDELAAIFLDHVFELGFVCIVIDSIYHI
jgi:hypothetical protein